MVWFRCTEMMLLAVSISLSIFNVQKELFSCVGRAIQHRKSSGAQIALYSLPGPGDAMWMSCTGASVAFNRERHEIMRSRKFKL